MSKRDLQRIEVLTEVLAGRRTTESAAGVLNVNLRQTQRLMARYGDGGGAALIHRARSRPSTNMFNAGVRDYVLEPAWVHGAVQPTLRPGAGEAG